MGIKAKYNSVDDRMELLIDLDREEPVLLVFTRALWLRLLRRLRVALQSSGTVCTDGVDRVPTKRNANRQDFSSLTALMVSGFRLLEREGDQWSLSFLSEERKCRLGLSSAGIGQVEELVFLQAERAGWDPAAALNRMRADDLAKDALVRAVNTRLSD